MSFFHFLKKIPPTRASRPTRTLRRRGSIVVLMAGGMVMFLGCAALAVDYGFLVNDANRLQRACDAAALAGAAELRTTTDVNTNMSKATTAAQLVFSQNGFPSANSTVSFDSTTTPTEVTVNGNTTRNFLFTVRGFYRDAITKGNVRRAATAAIRPGSGTNESSPIGITNETYNYWKNPALLGQEVTLTLIRQNKLTFAQETASNGTPTYDPMVLFDLRDSSGKSSHHFLEQFIGDELVPTPTTTTFTETTLDAAQIAQSGKLEQGVETLFQRASASPWLDTWGGDWLATGSTGTKANDIINNLSPRNNPRVVNILVADKTPSPQNGTFDATIRATVPVYIKSVKYTKGTGNASDIYEFKVVFLTPNNGGAGTSGSDSTESEGANGSGGYVISLVH